MGVAVGVAVGAAVRSAVSGAVGGVVSGAVIRTCEVPAGGLVAVRREECWGGVPRGELSLNLETFRTVLCCIVLYCVSYRNCLKTRYQILTRLPVKILKNSAARVSYIPVVDHKPKKKEKKRKENPPPRYRKLHNGAAQMLALRPPPTLSSADKLDSPPMMLSSNFFRQDRVAEG